MGNSGEIIHVYIDIFYFSWKIVFRPYVRAAHLTNGRKSASNVCWMETISYLLNVQTSISILLNIRCVVNMYTALNIQCNILNSLGVLFNCYKVYFKESCMYYCKNTFFLNVFFFFFSVLYICSISFYNFFGLAVTKSLTGKGGKNCLTYSYTKGLIVLFCAPFTHLCPRIPCMSAGCPNCLHPPLSLSRN